MLVMENVVTHKATTSVAAGNDSVTVALNPTIRIPQEPIIVIGLPTVGIPPSASHEKN